MRSLTLEQLKSFHQSLLHAYDAGLPVHVETTKRHVVGGTPRLRSKTAVGNEYARVLFQSELSEIEQAFASGTLSLESGKGNPLTEQYLNALKTWCTTDGSAVALDELLLSSLEARRLDLWAQIRMLQPVIWCVLASGSLFAISLLFVPGMASVRGKLGIKDDPILGLLSNLTDAFGPWVMLVPAVFAVLIFVILSSRLMSKKARKVDTRRNSVNRMTKLSAQATRLSALAEASESVSGAAELESEPEGNLKIHISTAGWFAESAEKERPEGELIGWALQSSGAKERSVQSPTNVSTVKRRLAFSAECYKEMANLQRASRDLSAQPYYVVFLAGLLVLLIGLTVFLPVINVLVSY